MWHVASVCHLQSYLRHFAFEAATWTICQVVTYDLLRLASCSSYWFASPSLGITLFISETPEKDTCATLRNTNWEIQLHSMSLDWFASLCACIWLCNADSASFFFCRLPSPSVALPPLPIFPFLVQPLNLKFKDSCRIQIKHILCVRCKAVVEPLEDQSTPLGIQSSFKFNWPPRSILQRWRITKINESF